MPAKKGNKKVVEKKEAPKKEEPKKEAAPKKEAPKKEAPKKEAPKKEAAPKKNKISPQEMEALRKQERKYRKKVRGCMNLKEQEHWGKVLDKSEKEKIAKEAEFRKQLAEIREKISKVSL